MTITGTPFAADYTPVMDTKGYGLKTGSKSTNKHDPMAGTDAKLRMQISGSRPIAQPPKRIEKARI